MSDGGDKGGRIKSTPVKAKHPGKRNMTKRSTNSTLEDIVKKGSDRKFSNSDI